MGLGGPGAAGDGETLTVLTFNVWHGLAGELRGLRLPGEAPSRREERFALQVEEIRRLAPDVLLLQEINPARGRARRYGRALGYEEIHQEVNCGIRLGPMGIPVNLREGLAILARPGLGLRRVAAVRLSGNGRCGRFAGLQTTETRAALVGEIRWQGRPVLLATAHLSHPPYVEPGFEAALGALVREGALRAEQLGEILGTLEERRWRNHREAKRLAEAIQSRRVSAEGLAPTAAIVGGDLNAEPGSETLESLRGIGLEAVSGPMPLPTWDPIANRENQHLGAETAPPLPTFGLPQVEALLAPRLSTPRQIDHVLFSPELDTVGVRRVLDRDRDGLYPSDHFGLQVTLRWR